MAELVAQPYQMN